KFVAKRATTKDEINGAVKRAAEQQLKGILGYTEAPNVSSDFNHDAHSSVFAMDQTKVMDGTLVRVMSWYDNEWGFSNRMVDTAVAMGKAVLSARELAVFQCGWFRLGKGQGCVVPGHLHVAGENRNGRDTAPNQPRGSALPQNCEKGGQGDSALP